MARLVFSVVVLMGVGVAWAQVQIPPGYEVVKITDDPEDDRYPRMNNCGEVVFRTELPDGRLAVFLYDNGKTTQVSVDGDFNTFPDINDHGVIVWSRWDDGTPKHIVIYEQGLITQLTDDPLEDWTPQVNNLGHVVWFRLLGGGCGGGADAEIMFYDGTTIEQLTDNGYSNQLGWINDHDEIVWTRYDFCVSPWESEIMLWIDGVTTQITTGQLETQVPSINNQRVVVWGGLDGIDVWDDGVTTKLTDWGHVPHVNNHGEIFFHRWHDEEEIRHVWWYRDGEFYQLTDDPLSNTARAINDYGEAAWWISEPDDHTDLGMMRRVRNGDVDLDFDVDVDDFMGFGACMTGPVDTDHLCECRLYDLDHDRDVDMADYVMLQTLFTGEGP